MHCCATIPAERSIPIGGRLYHWLVPILNGERADAAARALVALLAPAAALYAVGLEAYLALYRLGLRQRAKLPCTVVSIGNLVSGGTGKTGLTIALSRRLHERGIRVCILSRGFRSRCRSGVGAVSTQTDILMGPDEAGDEPFLLARALPGIPVLIGKDRRITGRLAVEEFQPDVIVLDDGAQYYQLHRDVEILLLSSVRPFGNGWPLPAGVLREPAGHLRRATAVVVHQASSEAPVTPDLSRRLRGLRVFTGRYVATALGSVTDETTEPLDLLRGKPVVTLCGVGNPGVFEESVARVGASVVGSYRLPDHGALRPEVASAIGREAANRGAEALVVTEKDAVKWPSATTPVPVLVLKAEFRVSDEQELVTLVTRAVEANKHGAPRA